MKIVVILIDKQFEVFELKEQDYNKLYCAWADNVPKVYYDIVDQISKDYLPLTRVDKLFTM